jgi:hypothetical protein
MSSELYERGLAVRREVVGREAVDALIEGADDFSKPMQDFVTEFCWGGVWSRPGLDRRSRSILNIGILAYPRRAHQWRHTRRNPGMSASSGHLRWHAGGTRSIQRGPQRPRQLGRLDEPVDRLRRLLGIRTTFYRDWLLITCSVLYC